MKIAQLTADLKSFGKVLLCEEKDGMFHVHITTGFENKFNTAHAVTTLVMEVVGDTYPYINKFQIDKDCFYLILKTTKVEGTPVKQRKYK